MYRHWLIYSYICIDTPQYSLVNKHKPCAKAAVHILICIFSPTYMYSGIIVHVHTRTCNDISNVMCGLLVSYIEDSHWLLVGSDINTLHTLRINILIVTSSHLLLTAYLQAWNRSLATVTGEVQMSVGRCTYTARLLLISLMILNYPPPTITKCR